MGKDPAFLFYDGDAARDVSHMNRLQRGAYFDFMQAQRKFCSRYDGNTAVLPEGIPVDTAKQVLGKDFDDCWPSLLLILRENNGFYFIPWLKDSITSRESYCQKQKERIKIRWNNRGNTAVIPCEDENVIENRNVSSNEKGIRGKQKTKEFIPPTIDEFRQYCADNGYSNIADRAYNGYQAAGWHDTYGKQIHNWKQKLWNGWFRDDNRDGRNQQNSCGHAGAGERDGARAKAGEFDEGVLTLDGVPTA